MKRLIFTLAILTAISVSCYYDSEESLYPELGNCDTINVTFSGDILPLLENNCFGCHASSVAADKGGEMYLQGYANVFANKDYILGSIRHEAANKPMPKDANKLKACLIQQFEIWVAGGALEN